MAAGRASSRGSRSPLQGKRKVVAGEEGQAVMMVRKRPLPARGQEGDEEEEGPVEAVQRHAERIGRRVRALEGRLVEEERQCVRVLERVIGILNDRRRRKRRAKAAAARQAGPSPPPSPRPAGQHGAGGLRRAKGGGGGRGRSLVVREEEEEEQQSLIRYGTAQARRPFQRRHEIIHLHLQR